MKAFFERIRDPLEYIPVQHSCGHFELRLMRWYKSEDKAQGYVKAQSPCTQCNAQGRPIKSALRHAGSRAG